MGLLAPISKFFQKDKYEGVNYLSLVLTSDRVAALIWTFSDGLVKELGFGQKFFTDIDLLLRQTAVAIDTAGEIAKVDFKKTVFGLSSYWMEENNLSPKSTKILKKLCDELELDPQAFVPLAAGINHFLKIEKLPSPQVITVGVFQAQTKQAFCEINLIDKDKVIDTKTSQLPSTAQNLQRLIEELKNENRQLPARIIIYGIDQSQALSAQIAKISWGDIFLHEPKLEFLDDKELAKSVAYAQAADLLGHEPLDFNQKSNETPKFNQLGFVEGEDILLSKSEPEEARPPATKAPPDFELTKSSRAGAPARFESRSESGGGEVGQAKGPRGQEETINEAETQDTAVVSPNVAKVYAVEFADQTLKPPFIPKFLNLIKLPTDPKKIAIALLILIILGLSTSFAAGQFLTRAEIIIKVNGQQHEDSFTATVGDQVPGETIKGIAQGNQKAVTTGSKKIGDPARGEVSILNWTTSPKQFSTGTAIIAQNGLKFTLDSEVEVASRSASIPGKNKVTAIALEVGSNSNLSQGTEFTFVQFDEISYSAQAETAFSGGSERQVTVVTKEDMDRLEKALTETTVTRAREDLKNKAAGKMVLDSAINIKITKKQFDKKLDEEAALLTLDMEVEAESLVFDENDLKKLIAENTNKALHAASQARPENIEILEITTIAQGANLALSGNFRANLVPRIDEEELKVQIAAKSPKEVRNIIKQTSQVSDVLINYSPNIPFITSIPRDSEKITFKIETD